MMLTKESAEKKRAQSRARSKKWYHKDLERSRKMQREAAARARKDPIKKARINARKRGGSAGLLPADIESMFAKQGGKCKICGTKESRYANGSLGPWNLDHCHQTNKVRAILCPPCNRGLAAFRENPDYLQNAIEYLGGKVKRQGVLSGATIRKLGLVTPFCERGTAFGLSFGLSISGYDIRIAQRQVLAPGDFKLGSSLEKFSLPNNVIGFLTNKSTNARRGLDLPSCILESKWIGNLTLELKNQGNETLILEAGYPIAQIIFQFTDEPTEGYEGKYQNQGPQPQVSIYE